MTLIRVEIMFFFCGQISAPIFITLITSHLRPSRIKWFKVHDCKIRVPQTLQSGLLFVVLLGKRSPQDNICLDVVPGRQIIDINNVLCINFLSD